MFEQCQAKIIIEGFDGVCFEKGASVPISVDARDSSCICGVFSLSNRSVTLNIHDRFVAGEAMNISFQVRNPADAQPSPDFYISASGISIPRTKMDKDNSSVADFSRRLWLFSTTVC